MIELSNEYLERLLKKVNCISDLDDVALNAEAALQKIEVSQQQFTAFVMLKDLIDDMKYMQSLIYEQQHAITCLMAERDNFNDEDLE